MEKYYKYSFLVPVYNVPSELLIQCINSLINQTYRNFEIIIVDDGSTDDSRRICDDFSEKYSNVLTIHTANKGLSSARNCAFSKSSGDFIMFVDGDDYLDSNCLDTINQILEKHYFDLIMFDVKSICNSTIKINHSFNKNYIVWENNNSKSLQKRVLDFNGKIAQVFAKCFNRNFLAQNEIMHNEFCKQGAEGILFNFEMFSFSPKTLYINQPLYNYVYNFDSISHKLSEENIKNTINCFEEIYKQISASNDETLLISFFTRMQYVIVTSCISGFANPDNSFSLKKIKSLIIKFNRIKIVKETYHFKNKNKMTFIRRATLFFIKYRLVLLIKFVAYLRYKSLRKGKI